MLSLVRLMFFIPQSATYAFFRTPIPAVSHLSKLGRSPEKFENDLMKINRISKARIKRSVETGSPYLVPL